MCKEGRSATTDAARRALAGLVVPDGQWHRWFDVVTYMTDVSELDPKACSNLIRQMEQAGELERRGLYLPNEDDVAARDEREIRHT